MIDYETLLEVFWQEHDPTRQPWSRQYAALVFTHDEEQAETARASRDARAVHIGKPIKTEIKPLAKFWRAEDYHQKYRLRHAGKLYTDLAAHFGTDRAFVDSTAAARLNGLLSGYGQRASITAELRNLDLPEPIVAQVDG